MTYDDDGEIIGDWGSDWEENLVQFAKSPPPYALIELLAWAIADGCKYQWAAMAFVEGWMKDNPDLWHE